MMVDFILCSSNSLGLCASLTALVQDMLLTSLVQDMLLTEHIELGWGEGVKNLLDERGKKKTFEDCLLKYLIAVHLRDQKTCTVLDIK